jgi:hypothetical protein
MNEPHKLSPKEIQSHLDQHIGIYPDAISTAALREAGCLEQVFPLPKPFNERVRFIANLLVQMVPKAKCDDSLRAAVGSLAQALSYSVNSKSWSDGTLHDFDERELARKIQRFAKT